MFVVFVCLFVSLFTHSRCSFTTESGTCQIWAKQFLLVVKFVDQFRWLLTVLSGREPRRRHYESACFQSRLVVVTGRRCFGAPADLVRQHAHCVAVLYAR